LVEIERHWGVNISDEQARHLRSVVAICDFIVDSLAQNGTPIPRDRIYAGLELLAKNQLRVEGLTPDANVLADFVEALGS
jgi:hypothetical protein